MRASITLVAALAAAVILAGCTPTPIPTPVESDAQTSASPTPTAEPSATPIPSASPSAPSPAPQAISDEEILTLCAARAPGADRPTRVVHFEQARIEQRHVDPPIFVYIPVTDNDPALAFADQSYYCIMSGTTADRAAGSFGVSNSARLTEEQIQQLIAENEPGDY